MTTQFPCHFAYRCLAQTAPEPKDADRLLASGTCAVCGGDAHAFGPARLRRRVLSDSFAPVETLVAPAAEGVCAACFHFASGATFQEAVARMESPVKVWPQVSWRNYSHLFTAAGHVILGRAGIRSLILDPPQPPFMGIVSEAGKKNLVHRAPIAHDRQRFPVLVEEAVVWVEPAIAREIMSDFESALSDGLRRDDLLTGDYAAASIFKVGRHVWAHHEDRMRGHRAARLRLLRLVHASAVGPPK